MSTLKTRITHLLPGLTTGKTATTRQLVARLNSSLSVTPVAEATVRGRLSELVASGVVARETRNSGLTGFYRVR